MRSRGITLLELLASISIAGIMVATAIPSFTNYIKDSMQSSSLTALKSDLYLTRSAAIRYRKFTVICVSNKDNSNCSEKPNWEDGWMAFIDIDNDGACNSNDNICADGGKVIKVGKGVSSANLKIRGYSHREYKIRYDPMGFSYTFNGKVIACDDRGSKKAKGLVISNTGRVRSTNEGDKLKCIK